jgi:hypothetical protein
MTTTMTMTMTTMTMTMKARTTRPAAPRRPDGRVA